MHLRKDICVSWKYLFLIIRRLYLIWFLREIYMEKVLQEFFYAPIPFKQYQNTSGCGTGLGSRVI